MLDWIEIQAKVKQREKAYQKIKENETKQAKSRFILLMVLLVSCLIFFEIMLDKYGH